MSRTIVHKLRELNGRHVSTDLTPHYRPIAKRFGYKGGDGVAYL